MPTRWADRLAIPAVFTLAAALAFVAALALSAVSGSIPASWRCAPADSGPDMLSPGTWPRCVEAGR